MESFFLNLGLSYTWSKALPYIIVILLGLAIGIFLFKKSKSKLTKILSIFTIGVPFGIYFAINPIYEGDFSNTARLVQHTTETSELKGVKLVVISMPGCYYCKESILSLKEITERHEKIKVEYVVASSDSSALDFYLESAKGLFDVRLAENPKAMAQVATDEGGITRYPTYVLVNNDNPMQTWSNNTFGISALDKVVATFK